VPNLFSYSPKELSTDAFLAWLFESFSTEPSLKGKESGFFYKLGLCSSKSVVISDIKVSRQEKKTDLIVRFLADGVKSQCLFENKVNTTIHSDQLNSYKAIFSGFDHYFYLKIGFMTFSEKLKAKSSGYELIDSTLFYDALVGLSSGNMIINSYIDFLKNDFIDKVKSVKDDVKNNEIDIFKDPYAQQYLMSLLHKNLHSILPPKSVFFRSEANSGGVPWTQLRIAKTPLCYGKKSEFLIWKIEKRKSGWFLKLMQYAEVDVANKSRKKSRLMKLRADIKSIPVIKELDCGAVSNRGVNSSDIVVFYFKSNHPLDLLKFIPMLSGEMVKIY